ncbi:beta-ketoacyl-ACP synthase III [Candidatus Poribacteria bacterium]|nr:beta-ketoacyl-ACP synthase III [Candidatus Poribacteria bacterium]
MELLNSALIGTGSFAPEKTLTNFDLEKMVDTSDEWIRRRTGMVERHIVDENTASSDLAIQAALKAIEKANIDPEEIDLIVLPTVTPDMSFPSTACFVQKGIGASNAAAFDISAGCSGFPYGISIADQFIKSGTYKTVLVIAAETLSKITDWTDRSTCVLFGDAAGAAVFQATRDNKGVISSYLSADGNFSGGNLLSLPAGGSRNPASHETVDKRMHYIKMRGRELFKLGVKAMAESGLKALELGNLTLDDVTLCIPHQANKRIIDAVGERLGLPEEKMFINVDKYGNTSSATMAVALDEAIRNEKVGSGDIVLIVAFGSGLTWAAIAIRL